MLSSDIGSMPAKISNEVIWSGARKTNSLLPLLGVGTDDYEIFKEELIDSFIDKLKAGVDVPNYPQFRDMNEMFFTLLDGIEKNGGALIAQGSVKSKIGVAIPETEIIKQESSRIKDESGADRVKVKACVTGPYTLASLFQYKSPSLYEELGHSIASILRESIFSNRSAELCHVSIDEPVLGFLNDPLLDYGSDGRESLRNAWEEIAYTGASHGLDVSMHLHNTSENLFWEVEHLGILASHVSDPLYTQESTKQRLEDTDKFLWAAVSITQYDTLIQKHYEAEGYTGNMPEKIGEVWTAIRKGDINPFLFLEERDLMRNRLKKIIQCFGSERIAYGSPECGLSSFPGYEVALECLRRASGIISEF
jgi:5-methyltetrahydropteroyltriglutamate--homocysteine methyltransferase